MKMKNALGRKENGLNFYHFAFGENYDRKLRKAWKIRL
jgi:hypothetical protein